MSVLSQDLVEISLNILCKATSENNSDPPERNKIREP